MTIPESPIIQIERRKAIAYIISALILALAIGGGLVKVGSGFASRSDNGIVVTGSARTEAIADNAVWTLSVSLSSAKVADAVTKVGNDVDAVTKYLTSGGILHAILGTTVIVFVASLISIPLGILAALYVTEVRGRLTPYVRFFVQAMSGVPSIVAGLFVYAALVVSGIVQFSGLAGAIALSILMLPTVARTAEEVLLLVPDDLRSAALALGATQRKVIRMVVLPSSGAGLVTASILGIARVTGETAPLLFTAFGSTAVNVNPFTDPMAALPIYIFTQLLLGTDNDVARAWFACMVLMIMVGLLFTIARLAVGRRALK